MKPAPIMPTRTGLPAAARAASARSTMIMPAPLRSRREGASPVLVGDQRHRLRPRDGERRVVVAQAALAAGRVELAHLIADLGAVSERLVAVREHGRHVQRAAVILVELDGEVLQVGRRVGSQVDDHVVDRASGAAHELGLGGRRHLVVHAAQRAAPVVEGHVALGNERRNAVRLELLPAEGACEKAAVVLAPFEVDDEGARKRCLGENHRTVQ